MKNFLFNIIKFCIPIIIVIIVVIWLDFFKIFGFQDYYSDQMVQLNREVVTTKTFNHYNKQENFDSFIFGSSRSQAFKCQDWKHHLNPISKPFHFDASGEGIWGITKKIQYIDEGRSKINNALIIIDRSTLSKTHVDNSHLAIPTPEVSKNSAIHFYATFLSASLNPKFLMAYLDYSIFQKHREYMGDYIIKTKFKHTVDKVNCDMWYGMDKEIEIDSIAYYNKQFNKNMFHARPVINTFECPVTNVEIQQLQKIKSIFDKHKTDYKIVISPVYNQIPMEEAQLSLLHDIFGAKNVYNFSGENKLTIPIGNYYEWSHYRPHVAREIMNIIYNDEL